MPDSNSTVRKRRRGNFVIPTDESRAAKKSAEAAKAEEEKKKAEAAKAEEEKKHAKAEEEDEEMEEAEDGDPALTQLLEASMDDTFMDEDCQDEAL